jgi:hypothetical protein
MVAWYADLPAVRQVPEPVVEIEDGSGTPAHHGVVSCVNKQIAGGHIKLAMKFVRVRDSHDGEVRRLDGLRVRIFSCSHILIYRAQGKEGKELLEKVSK